MIKFEFSALEEVRKNVKEQIQNQVNDLVYEHSADLYKRILKRTPYCSGKLFRGWDYNPKHNEKGWAVIEIFNEVPYGVYVNNGTVESDGNFMVELSLQEVEQNLRRELMKQNLPVLKKTKSQPQQKSSLKNVPKANCKESK